MAWLAFLAAAAAGVGLWLRLLPRERSAWPALAAVGVLLAAVGGAAAWDRRVRGAADERAAAAERVPREGRGGGYVSSSACRACHPAEYASWHRSYHRTMTQYPTAGAVKADLERMPGGREARIGLVTGSHHMQVFWASEGPGNRMRLLPDAWLIEDRRWVPIADTFLVDPRLPAYQPGAWNVKCSRCHATAIEPRMEADGATDSRSAELGIGCESCHGPGEAHVAANASPARRYALAMRGGPDPTIVNPARLPARRSAEACGQCHGVSGIADVPGFLAGGVGYRPGEPLDEYKPPLVPGEPAGEAHLRAVLAEEPAFVANRFWSDGVVRVIGREWSALMKSACHLQGGMTCLSCHSMHRSDPVDQLAAGAEGDGACVGCHGGMRGEAALTAHTHHAAGSAGSRCYNCHMPHTSYGLLKASRSHFIESPDVARTVATGRPNACSLCHLDRPLGWVAEWLERWYDRRAGALPEDERGIAAGVRLALAGDAAQRALVAWAMGWRPAQEASGTDWLPGYLALAMRDPYSAVRYVAARSLRSLPAFAGTEYDYVAPAERLRRDVEAVIARWKATRRAVPEAERQARLLLLPDGGLDGDGVGAALGRRDDRRVEISE